MPARNPDSVPADAPTNSQPAACQGSFDPGVAGYLRDTLSHVMTMKKIILGVDNESSGGAPEITAELAARLGARVAVIHLGDRATFGEDAEAEIVKPLQQCGVTFYVRLEQLRAHVSVADSLVKMADAIRADLIVLGSRGRPAPVASLFGSVSREVARSAHVPVLIVRDATLQEVPRGRMLLVVTPETLGSSELGAGLELARALNAKVTILHVHGPMEEAFEDLLRIPASRRPDEVAKLLLDKFEAAGIEANLVIADNRDGLAKEITRTALESGCDLIVIPAAASDIAERWVMGTVDEEVGRRSGSAVLVAPPTASTRTDCK